MSSAKGTPQRTQSGAAMKLKPGQQVAQSAPGVATISLQPRHSGGSTASSSRRPASAQIRPSDIVRLRQAIASPKGQFPTRRHAFALHTRAWRLPIPCSCSIARLARPARACGPRWGRRRSSSARSPPAWSSGSTTCGATSRWRSISAATATRSATALEGRATIQSLVRADLGLGFARQARGPALVADEEALPFAPGCFDLVLSAMACTGSTTCRARLIQIARILKPDGLFLGAMLGGATLWQLRAALTEAESEIEGGLSPRVSPFADLRDAAGLLQRAGFALPVADSETIDVEYESALALMRDLGAMGESQPGGRAPPRLQRRATLLRAAEIYARALRPDHRAGSPPASRCCSCTAGRRMRRSPSRSSRAARRIAWPRRSARPSGAPARRLNGRRLVKLGFGEVLSESFDFFFSRLAALLPSRHHPVDPVAGAAHRAVPR